MIGPEITLRLQHVWPKDQEDLTEIDLGTLSDPEARRIVQQVEDIKAEFVRFVAVDVLPRIPRKPTAFGRVETVRLFTSNNSMVTDYLLLLSGILGSTGGVLDLILERYTISETTELGLFMETETLEVPDSGDNVSAST